jgi:hypothetical protein
VASSTSASFAERPARIAALEAEIGRLQRIEQVLVDDAMDEGTPVREHSCNQCPKGLDREKLAPPIAFDIESKDASASSEIASLPRWTLDGCTRLDGSCHALACSASQISLTDLVQLTRSNADIRSVRGWRRRRPSANAASRMPMITDENM